MGNNRGSITILGLLLCLTVLGLLAMTVTHSMIQLQKIKRTGDLYLCAKYLNVETYKYRKTMDHLNKGIRVAFYGQALPYVGAASSKTLKALIAAQELYHISYLKNLTINRYCSSTQGVSYIKNLPFKTISKIKLMRSFDQTVKKREGKWSNIITEKNIFTRLELPYALTLHYDAKTLNITHLSRSPNLEALPF